jgi:pimeloyl-ACP methyl ester carboxylesterase
LTLRMVGATVLLVLSLTTYGWALRPEIGYQVVPSDYGIIHDDVTFPTSDSLSLRGWFFPAQDTTGIANELVGRLMPVPADLKLHRRPYDASQVEPGPAIVICPGDAGNMAYSILYAYNLFTRGFHVLAFDWRGFGESDAWPLETDRLVYSEFLTDYAAALDYLMSRPETDRSRVGLLGFSTGAYLSFAMAADRDDVAALAARAIITSFEDLAPILARLDPDREWRFPEDYPEDLFPINAAGRIGIPVMLVVGDRDERTPSWMSQSVYDSLAGPKELWIVPGAGHGGVAAPELMDYPAFFERVGDFFTRHLGNQDVEE